MIAERLLWLYPRKWRERYGDEFLALTGDRPLVFRQVVDIVSAAIDARLSLDMRRMAGHGTNLGGEGDVMMATLKRTCLMNAGAAVTIRDGLIGAGVIVGGSIAVSALAAALTLTGHRAAGEAVKRFALPVTIVLWAHFMYLRAQPWKVQAVFLGAMAVLLTIGLFL